jgi:dTDP-4-dehydrorhamnose 3,5-epimerase
VIFEETPLSGSWLIDLDRIEDVRGFFARAFCSKEFAARGLEPEFVQCNISYNGRRGTLRGMHYQRTPFEEAKLVRCTAGAIHDVIVDLRPGSPTFAQHFGAALTAANRRMLFIPKGFAHGFLTLEDDSEVFYQMSSAYVPGSAAGLRFDDPGLDIAWPAAVNVISDRDLEFPPFDAERFSR